MSVAMICPNLKCQRTLVAPDSARGKIVRCAYCHQPFMVPIKSTELPPVLPEEPQNKSKR